MPSTPVTPSSEPAQIIGPLAVREYGPPTGPPLLLLHGGASSAATWARFTPELVAAGFRVVAPDLRGHGDSARTPEYPLSGLRDDLLDLLDALEIKDFTLVGHSLGGYLASLVAQARPDRVTRLVLEDPPAPPPDPGAPDGMSIWRTALFGLTLLAARSRRYDRRALLSVHPATARPGPGLVAGAGRGHRADAGALRRPAQPHLTGPAAAAGRRPAGRHL